LAAQVSFFCMKLPPSDEPVLDFDDAR